MLDPSAGATAGRGLASRGQAAILPAMLVAVVAERQRIVEEGDEPMLRGWM